MKRVFVFLLASLTGIFVLDSCKKTDNNPPPAEPSGLLSIINLDTVDSYKIITDLTPDTVLLKSGESLKALTIEKYFVADMYWINQSTQFKTRYITEVAPQQELSLFILQNSTIQQMASTCITPPSGKSILRFNGNENYDTLETINANGDTVKVIKNRYDEELLAFVDTCNFVAAGNYKIKAFSAKLPTMSTTDTTVSLKAGAVYTAVIWAGNKIKLIEQ